MDSVVWGSVFAVVAGALVIAFVLWSYFSDRSDRDDPLAHITR